MNFLVSVLNLDDRPIHQHADGYGNPGKAHDVRRYAEKIHWNESQPDGYGDGDDGNHGRWKMPEEQEDDQAHDQHLHQELFFQVIYRSLNEIRAVIHSFDFHALRQSRLQVLNFCLYPLDDIQGVLAVSHDHDTAHDIAEAVELGQAAAYLGSQRHGRYVFQQDRRSPARFDHNLSEIILAPDVSLGPHHIFLTGPFYEAATRLVVVPLNRVNDIHE